MSSTQCCCCCCVVAVTVEVWNDVYLGDVLELVDEMMADQAKTIP